MNEAASARLMQKAATPGVIQKAAMFAPTLSERDEMMPNLAIRIDYEERTGTPTFESEGKGAAS